MAWSRPNNSDWVGRMIGSMHAGIYAGAEVMVLIVDPG